MAVMKTVYVCLSSKLKTNFLKKSYFIRYKAKMFVLSELKNIVKLHPRGFDKSLEVSLRG